MRSVVENSERHNIHEIAPDKERADKIRSVVEQAVQKALEDMGVELGGFALVVWSMGGRCYSCYECNTGLVYRGIVPSLVHDALQRHITIDMVREDTGSDVIEPA